MTVFFSVLQHTILISVWLPKIIAQPQMKTSINTTLKEKENVVRRQMGYLPPKLPPFATPMTAFFASVIFRRCLLIDWNKERHNAMQSARKNEGLLISYRTSISFFFESI